MPKLNNLLIEIERRGLELTSQGKSLIKNGTVKVSKYELKIIDDGEKIKLYKNNELISDKIDDIVYNLKNYYKLLQFRKRNI